MFDIQMTLEEIRVLASLLEHEIREIHSEIHHTDDRAYRERLRTRELLLQDMLLRVEENSLSDSA